MVAVAVLIGAHFCGAMNQENNDWEVVDLETGSNEKSVDSGSAVKPEAINNRLRCLRTCARVSKRESKCGKISCCCAVAACVKVYLARNTGVDFQQPPVRMQMEDVNFHRAPVLIHMEDRAPIDPCLWNPKYQTIEYKPCQGIRIRDSRFNCHVDGFTDCPYSAALKRLSTIDSWILLPLEIEKERNECIESFSFLSPQKAAEECEARYSSLEDLVAKITKEKGE